MKRPSEEEIQARKTFEGMHEIAVEELGGIAEYQDQVATLMADGWDRTLAETVAGFEHWGAEAGIAHDYVVAKYAEYQAAVKAGDAERMAAIEEEVNAWRAAGDERNRIAEATASVAMSAFYSARDAGVQAYDETLQAAIEAGAGEEDAVAQALAAQLAASAEVQAEKGREFAFDAAMNAAMALGAEATAEERKAAAEDAARVATESWGVAMEVVTESDQAATEAMKEDWTGPDGVQQETENGVHGRSGRMGGGSHGDSACLRCHGCWPQGRSREASATRLVPDSARS